jgi:hypothetical protein
MKRKPDIEPEVRMVRFMPEVRGCQVSKEPASSDFATASVGAFAEVGCPLVSVSFRARDSPF